MGCGIEEDPDVFQYGLDRVRKSRRIRGRVNPEQF